MAYFARRLASVVDAESGFILIAPLRAHDEIFGALCVERASDLQPFTDGDCNLFEAFAEQAALAVRNAPLYREAKQPGGPQMNADKRRWSWCSSSSKP